MARWMIISLWLLPHLASGATGSMTAQITDTLNSNSSKWGGCMVQLNKEIRRETGLDCNSSWVTFSCSGELSPKDQAYKMYDSAQLAMAMDYTVKLYLDDSQKQSGFCLATRIDVAK